MYRKTLWKKTVTSAVNQHQDQALSSTIFILNEFGPTGFLLKEDGESKTYKVCLGDPHTCTCVTFQKEKDLCKHICWILMRKFRLPSDHEYCFQSGLVDRQILEVLQGLHRARTPHLPESASSAPSQPGSSREDGTIRQKAIGEDDICPICQEELLKKRLPVTYCRFGCGNNVHIFCMKVWAEHQTRSETEVMVKCPLCREDFGALKLLLEQVKAVGKLCTSSERERLDKHLGIPCNDCRVCPVVGKCFKCTICRYFHLCEDCFKRSSHSQHSFSVRMKRNQPWQVVVQNVDHNSDKPQIIDSQLMHNNFANSLSIMSSEMSDVVPAHVLKTFPVIRVRQSSRLLEVGMQCRLCLQSFHLGQHVKTLPCRHKFHTGCIDTWLRQSICCPLDWEVLYNPLTWNKAGLQKPLANAAKTSLMDQLFIPGTGLLDRTVMAPSLQSTHRSDVSTAVSSVECLTQSTRSLCINNTKSGSETYSRESSSIQRCRSLGKAPVSTTKRKAVLKASYPDRFSHLTPAFIITRMEVSEKTKQSFFPKLNEHVIKPKTSALHGQSRIRPHPSSGGLISFDLSISAKPQRNQE